MQIESRVNWMPAQNGRLAKVGAVDIFGKKWNPVSAEMGYSYWLKGDKSDIALTMGSHDCVQAHFAV